MDDKKVLKLLRRIKRYMKGNESWKHGWMNYPSKPEITPKILMNQVIKILKGEEI